MNADLSGQVASTYFAEGVVAAAAVAANGDLYLGGTTDWEDFPATAGAFDTTIDPLASATFMGDGFVSAFDAALSGDGSGGGGGGGGNDPVADLSLTMTDSPDPVRKGESLLYSITIVNSGPDAGSGTGNHR